MPRDYYVKMEYLAQMDDYLSSLTSLVQLFNSNLGGTVSNKDIAQMVTDTVQFEIKLALAMVPDELLRNYEQQYNLYTLSALQAAYPNLGWTAYMQGALADVDPSYQKDHYVVVQPAYFAAVDSMIGGQRVNQKTLANFVGLRLLVAFSEFVGGDARKLSRQIRQFSQPKRTRRTIKFYDEASQSCVDYMMGLMPYGPGYIYVKNIPDRDAVVADVSRQTTLVIDSFLNMTHSLKWLDDYSLQHVMNKSEFQF